MNGSEDQYRLIVDSMDDGVGLCDPEGRFVYVSPSLTRLTGLAREDLLGRDGSELAHPDDRAQLLQALRATPGTNPGPAPATTDVEWRRRTPDGSYRWLSTRCKLLLDPAGNPFRLLSQSTDITDRKKTEAALAESHTLLSRAQKMEAVGRLAGGIAHDFNNLLTVIAGYGSLLLEQFPPGEETHEALLEVQRAADRAADLTRQLLAFGSRQMLTPVVLDLNALLGNLQPTLEGVLGEPVRGSLALDPRPAPVKVDPVQLEQVLLNLAEAARDAMPEGGEFALATSHVMQPLADAKTGDVSSNPQSYVRLTVRDTGRGMDATRLAHVFEPFFPVREGGQGSGMGLAAAYGIIKQSGGWIEARSEPGHGTTFTIYLPAAPVHAPGAEAAAAKPNVLARGTVLLVEDEPAVRSLTRQVLQEQGYTVLEAPDGAEGLEVSSRHSGPINLLLTDLSMPEMSGFEVARRLLERRPETRVLFMSGYVQESTLFGEPILGRRPRFLAKPFRLADLLRQVRDTLQAREG